MSHEARWALGETRPATAQSWPGHGGAGTGQLLGPRTPAVFGPAGCCVGRLTADLHQLFGARAPPRLRGDGGGEGAARVSPGLGWGFEAAWLSRRDVSFTFRHRHGGEPPLRACERGAWKAVFVTVGSAASVRRLHKLKERRPCDRNQGCDPLSGRCTRGFRRPQN